MIIQLYNSGIIIKKVFITDHLLAKCKTMVSQFQSPPYPLYFHESIGNDYLLPIGVVQVPNIKTFFGEHFAIYKNNTNDQKFVNSKPLSKEDQKKFTKIKDIIVEVDDKTIDGGFCEFGDTVIWNHTFHEYQIKAINLIEEQLSRCNRFNLYLDPSGGKTVISAETIRRFKTKTLVIVPSTMLREQMFIEYKKFLPNAEISECKTKIDFAKIKDSDIIIMCSKMATSFITSSAIIEFNEGSIGYTAPIKISQKSDIINKNISQLYMYYNDEYGNLIRVTTTTEKVNKKDIDIRKKKYIDKHNNTKKKNSLHQELSFDTYPFDNFEIGYILYKNGTPIKEVIYHEHIIISNIGLVIIDEIHLCCSGEYCKIFSNLSSKYMMCMSGTGLDDKKDGRLQISHLYFGIPINCNKNILCPPKIGEKNISQPVNWKKSFKFIKYIGPSIYTIPKFSKADVFNFGATMTEISGDEFRTQLCIDILQTEFKDHEHVFIFVERVELSKAIVKYLQSCNISAGYIDGKMKPSEKQNQRNKKFVAATRSCLGTGISWEEFTGVFFWHPGKSNYKQYINRIFRINGDVSITRLGVFVIDAAISKTTNYYNAFKTICENEHNSRPLLLPPNKEKDEFIFEDIHPSQQITKFSKEFRDLHQEIFDNSIEFIPENESIEENTEFDDY